MVKLNNISFEDDGFKITYDYSLSPIVSKYFKGCDTFFTSYELDVSEVPTSIAVIPFVSNFITIAWFAGFDIEVKELDKDFYDSLLSIKKDFEKWYPSLSLKGSIYAKKLIQNKKVGTKQAMLFSGGVDAFATYIREYKNKPDLITIHGPDIDLNDLKQWQDLTTFINNEPLLLDNNKNYIKTNVRDFYNYKVNLLISGLDWWGKIQHGLSLLGVTAPLAYLKNYSSLAIASSYTKEIDINWGSTPVTDEKISWGGLKVIHDGYELRRQDKVDLIAEFVSKNDERLRLRVCYSELREEFNCSNCEKCFRTMLGLVLSGQNPNRFGFKIGEEFYDRLFATVGPGHVNKGMKYFWWELMEKAKTAQSPFIFMHEEEEKNHITKIANGIIDNYLNDNNNLITERVYRTKYILRNKFSNYYNAYLKLRYKK